MSDLPDMDSARWFAALARDLAEQPDRDATASRVLELITGATGCSFATIAHLSPQGTLLHNHSTDQELLGKLTAISTSTEEGVAWQALRERATMRVNDLDSESRWPLYTARLRAETPFRSALGYCLILDNLVLGALVLFSTEPGYFTDAICRFADVYADHAAIALARVTDHQRAENLETALQSNREIGMAVGILMVRYGLTDQAAFDLLRVTSQHEHRKLREIAAETVYSGEIPQRAERAALRLA
ncbi:MAG: GAF and ANTAR domain-containing protein [Jatrophihabitantaceae bacterium]